MAKKKKKTKRVTKKVDEGKKIDGLSFFGCEELQREVAAEAAMGEGALTDEQVGRLIDVQTQSVKKVASLCRYIKLLEATEKTCAARIAEAGEVKKRCATRRKRFMDRLAPWVDVQGKTYHAEEFLLSTRLSSAVIVDDGFADPFFCSQKVTLLVNKSAIKEALDAGREVSGASKETRINLTIK